MRVSKKHLGVAFGLSLVASLAAGPASAARDVPNYSPVTQQRLENPEPGNWLMYRRTYDGHVFSPLNQINSSNVGDLVPVWTFSTGVIEGHESPPIVNNGVMFVTTPMNQIIALDAKTGEVFWRYKRAIPDDLTQLHPTNRGVGLWQDKLMFAATDGYLVSVDAKTGKEVWSTKTDDYRKGYYMTLAPLVVGDKVYVGGSGGEFGIRGWVAAYDAATGKQVWRTPTIPAPGEPGADTWQGDAWKTGGGSAWLNGNYDAKRKVIYWGVGNAAPWPGDGHPGDNLYTSSVIALDPDTGAIKTHFQYHQNDSWDWDEVDPPMIVTMQVNGQSVDRLVHPARDGYLWVLDPTGKDLKYVSAQPFVYQNVFKGVDAETGRPIVDPDHKPVMGKRVEFCPSLWGGKDWPSASYNDHTGMLYIPANENLCGAFEGRREPHVAGQLWLGTDPNNLELNPRAKDHVGELQAWDLSTGKKVWAHNFPTSQLFASVLSTDGNLVFAGGTNDRMFRAFDAKTGEVKWQQKTNSGIMAMPMSYEVDGTQYIAVQSGWGVDAQRIQDSLSKTSLKYDPDQVPQGGVVWVFALKSQQKPQQ